MAPEVIADRNRVVRAAGRGGMGTVWLRRDERLGRDVALKQVGLLPGEQTVDVDRALREARTLAVLNHRNVVGGSHRCGARCRCLLRRMSTWSYA